MFKLHKHLSSYSVLVIMENLRLYVKIYYKFSYRKGSACLFKFSFQKQDAVSLDHLLLQNIQFLNIKFSKRAHILIIFICKTIA